MNRVVWRMGWLVVLVGCVPQPSGRKLERVPVLLRGPEERQTLLRGATLPINIAVDRPADFAEDVTLKVAVYPPDKGVSAEAIPATLRPGDDRTVRLNVTATPTAPEGEYTVVVRGRYSTGQAPPLELTFRLPGGN